MAVHRQLQAAEAQNRELKAERARLRKGLETPEVAAPASAHLNSTTERVSWDAEGERARQVADEWDAREAERVADECDAREAEKVADRVAARRKLRVTRSQAKEVPEATAHGAGDVHPEPAQAPTGPKVIELSSDSDDDEVTAGHGENPLRPYDSDDSDDAMVQCMASMSVSPGVDEGSTASPSQSGSDTQGWQRPPSIGLTGYDVPVVTGQQVMSQAKPPPHLSIGT